MVYRASSIGEVLFIQRRQQNLQQHSCTGFPIDPEQHNHPIDGDIRDHPTAIHALQPVGCKRLNHAEKTITTQSARAGMLIYRTDSLSRQIPFFGTDKPDPDNRGITAVARMMPGEVSLCGISDLTGRTNQ